MTPGLACRLEATAAPGGVVGLALTLINTGGRSATVTIPEPFTDLSLRAWVGGGEVSVAIPPTSLQVRPVPHVLEPGEPHPLPVPISLRFDPDALYGAGQDTFSWALVSAPGPLELEATVTVEGAALEPCRAWVD